MSSRRKTPERELLKALLQRKMEYERFFASRQNSEELDHKAEQAYAGLIKTIYELMKKTDDTQKKDLKKEASRIIQEEYGIRFE
jgi:hypothetical protein